MIPADVATYTKETAVFIITCCLGARPLYIVILGNGSIPLLSARNRTMKRGTRLNPVCVMTIQLQTYPVQIYESDDNKIKKCN